MAAYPYPSGYCAIEDIQARINAGTWTGGIGSYPTASQAEAFIAEGAATIDLTLAKSGYTLPLAVAAGFTPTTNWSGLSSAVLAHLRAINASLATAMVERVRHGSAEESADTVGDYWMHLADDLLRRIEDGADNLAVLGLAGTFAAVANRSLGLAWTGATDSQGLGTKTGAAFRVGDLY